MAVSTKIRASLVFLRLILNACASISVHDLYTSDAVLQRGRPQIVSGKANGEVILSVRGMTDSGIQYLHHSHAVSANGTWSAPINIPASGKLSLTLRPIRRATEPRIIIETEDELPAGSAVAKNIAFGDVYLCGGAGDMLLPLAQANTSLPRDVARAISLADIRLFAPGIPHSNARLRKGQPPSCGWDGLIGSTRGLGCSRWLTGPNALALAPATCLLTAIEIARRHNELHVPIGLIIAAMAGSTAGQWTPPDVADAADCNTRQMQSAASSADAVGPVKGAAALSFSEGAAPVPSTARHVVYTPVARALSSVDGACQYSRVSTCVSRGGLLYTLASLIAPDVCYMLPTTPISPISDEFLALGDVVVGGTADDRVRPGGPPVEVPEVPGALFSPVLARLAGFPLKGALWSGGEREAELGASQEYAACTWTALIRGLRRAWGDPLLPFA